jgi:hypothetical protein
MQLDAFGISATPSYALPLGILTRVLLAIASLALLISSLHPQSVWQKPVLWLSLSTLVEAFLSFFLLLHSAQTIFSDTFGTIPPLTGNAVVPGNVLGLDLNSYPSPTITSSFILPYYLGWACLILLGGTESLRFILHPRLLLPTGEPSTGLGEVYLSPPYVHAWYTSTDENLNPLKNDPGNLSDDELALSFERILHRVRPGGAVSIILPGWATILKDRLVKVVPWTGFKLEKSEIIYRAPGRPENELLFRKPVDATSAKENPEPTASTLAPPDLVEPSTHDTEQPPVPETVEEPAWSQPKQSKKETVMVKSATRLLERHREPVPYRELLNEVYMDLLDKKINFDSSKEIEATLLAHIGQELTIIEKSRENDQKHTRQWWLGETRPIEAQEMKTSLLGRLASVRKKIPRVTGFLKIPRKKRETGYKPRKETDEN